ncbi:MAG TPA: DUF6807 family protein [Candidatus Limnocylindrales bacterium]
MRLRVGAERVDFLAGDGRIAGRYVFVNEFKPSLHPVNTPAGHTITLSMPHDHRHHRGIMYGLATRDLNFWEERPVRPGQLVGIQRHESFHDLTERGEAVGFEEAVLWLAQDGRLPTFRESRSLSCRLAAGGSAFEWTWSSRLEALRDLDLTVSHWAHTRADGRRINYHGLGVRFRREFGGGVFGGTTLYVDGRETSFDDALGVVPQEVTFVGTIDGWASPPTAGLTIRQREPNALFAMKDPFPLVCLGPTNAGPLSLKEGQVLISDYDLSVFDG